MSSNFPKQRDSLNVLTAFILTAPLWVRASEDIKNDYARNKELADRFDPYKVDIGMTPDVVESRLGKPSRIVRAHDDTILVFGSENL